MRHRRPLIFLASLLTAILLAGSAVADPSPGTAAEPALQDSGGSPARPQPVHPEPTVPAPTVGTPKGAPPADAAPHGDHPAAMPKEKPAQDGVPKSPMPTTPSPKTKPTTSTPSLPKPAEGQPKGPAPQQPHPTAKPETGKPGSAAPDTPAPHGNPPAPVEKIRVALKTITEAEFLRLMQSGHSRADIIQADAAAAAGAGTVVSLLEKHAAGTDWKELVREGKAVPAPNAAALRKFLAEVRNEQLRSLVESVASQAGTDTDGLLALMGKKLTLADVQTAVKLASITAQPLNEVLALRDQGKSWEAVAKELKPGK